MSEKLTYRLARHCRLGSVGDEVQLTEAEAQEISNETPGALEGVVKAPEPERDSPVTRATKKDSEAP